MGAPWKRIKEYINILSSLQLHTPKEHEDQEHITNVLNKLREIYLYVKQVNKFQLNFKDFKWSQFCI